MPRSTFLPVLATLLLTTNSAFAQAAFSPADCAAFWYGRDDYAKRSKGLPRDPADLSRARQAEAAAVAQGGAGAKAEIDAQRGDMQLLFEATVELDDGQSRDLMNGMTAACTNLAATLP